MTMHNPEFHTIEQRRTEVQKMRARSMSEQTIANTLGVDQATISRDIKAIREASKRYVYSLAKDDLADEFKRGLDTLDEVQCEAWALFGKEGISEKHKLAALKVIIESVESRSKLLNEGPTVLMYKSLDDRVSAVINNGRQQEDNKNKI